MGFLIFAFLTSFVFSCKRSADPNAFHIVGRIDGATGKTLYLEELTVRQLQRVDSVKINSSGNFSFAHVPGEKGFYMVKIANGDFITLVLDKQDSVQIEANLTDGSIIYDLIGSPETEILRNYLSYTDKNLSKIDSLGKLFLENKQKEDFYLIRQHLDSAFQLILLDQKAFTRKTVLESPHSLATLLVLNQRLGAGVILNEDEDFDLFSLVDSTLYANYPENTHVISHHDRVKQMVTNREDYKRTEEKLGVGKKIPDISLMTPEDSTVQLNSLNSKIVMLFFWASSSPRSRAEIQKLKLIYDQYKSKGLEIYAVSLDIKKEFWENSIELESLEWINVSDLEGNRSPAVKLFNVPDKLPYYFLIDERHIIVTKGGNFSTIEMQIAEMLSD